MYKKDNGKVDIKRAVMRAALEVGVSYDFAFRIYKHHIRSVREALRERKFVKIRLPFLGAFIATEEELELGKAINNGLRGEELEELKKSLKERTKAKKELELKNKKARNNDSLQKKT